MAKLGGFSLKDILNKNSQGAGEPGEVTKAAEHSFRIELISVYQLEPSAENFYSVADVDDLKDSIEILGVQQNLTVRPILGTDKYKVIAGHRRRLASLRLVEEGKSQHEYIPCRVETDIDELREKLTLIYTNSTTRQLSEWEKIEQAEQLVKILREYKKNHDLPGRIRELMAEALNVSPSQIGRMESISKNLTPELKEELKQDRIGFSAAAELSRLSIDNQKAVYEKHKETGITGLKEVRGQRAAPLPKPDTINPELQALKLVKELLLKELSRFNPSGIDSTITAQYYSKLNQLLQGIEKELFEMQGKDLFAQGGAADGG